jgi:hypothetical protein
VGSAHPTKLIYGEFMPYSTEVEFSDATASVEQVIGVALVGTGFGQKVHIPGFQAHPRTQLVAVYHRNLDKAIAIANAKSIPHACNTIKDLVALPQVQAVSISTPHFSSGWSHLNAFDLGS